MSAEQQEKYDYFDKSITIYGKHARMIREMWVKNDYSKTYFKRLVDLYVLAPIIGFRVNHKANLDYSGNDTAEIFLEQVGKVKQDMEFIMQMILLLEDDLGSSEKEKVDHAFRGPQTNEEYNTYCDLFQQYTLGGIEVLYQRLVVEKTELFEEISEQRTGSIMTLFKRFE